MGSNYIGDMGVLSVVCCVSSGRGLRVGLITRPGVLLTVVRRCVWSRNLMNEDAMARVGPQRHRGGIAPNMHSVESPIMLLSIYPIVLLLTCLLPVYKRTTEPEEANQQCHAIKNFCL